MSETAPGTTERNPFTRPAFIISAALIAALIAAVTVLLLVPRGGGNDSEAAPAPFNGTKSSAPATPAAAEESVCGLPSSDQTALGGAPASDWELVGNVVVPTDPETFGPGLIDGDGFRSCFAQSPTGALYAAANLLGLGSIGDIETQRKLLERLTVPGPGQQAALRDLSESAAAPSLQISGFRLLAYSDEEATVDLAFTLETGAVGHVSVPLRWHTGDWKVQVSDAGDLLNEPEQLKDLGDYIPWAGV